MEMVSVIQILILHCECYVSNAKLKSHKYTSMSSVSLNAISYNIYVYIAKVLQPDTASHLHLVTQEFYIQKHSTQSSLDFVKTFSMLLFKCSTQK